MRSPEAPCAAQSSYMPLSIAAFDSSAVAAFGRAAAASAASMPIPDRRSAPPFSRALAAARVSTRDFVCSITAASVTVAMSSSVLRFCRSNLYRRLTPCMPDTSLASTASVVRSPRLVFSRLTTSPFCSALRCPATPTPI